MVQAYSLNVTAVPQGVLGYLSIGNIQTQAVVSTLNADNGQVVANAAIAPGTSTRATPGFLAVFVTGTTDVVIDTTVGFAPL